MLINVIYKSIGTMTSEALPQRPPTEDRPTYSRGYN